MHAGAGCRGGGRCGGAGWVQVTASYAERLFPMPAQATLDDADQAAAWAAIAESVERRRSAALDSWYPCKDCNGATFYRWAGRHLDSNHSRAGCAECELAGERHPHRNRERANSLEPAADNRPEF